MAPSRIVAGGRRLPPTVDPQHYFFFFLAAFFFIDSVTSSPFWIHRSTLGREARRSVAHGLAPEMFGLLAPTPLVMHEVGVELRQTYHPEPALLQRAVEHAGVVGRE